MRYALMMFFVAMSTATSLSMAEEAAEKALQGESLRRAVAGKTVHLATPMGALPISFRIDGSMFGRAGDLASYTGSAQDRGRWWVATEKLCQRWQTWLGGQTYCFILRQQGKVVHWVRNDGLSGKANITR